MTLLRLRELRLYAAGLREEYRVVCENRRAGRLSSAEAVRQLAALVDEVRAVVREVRSHRASA